jgi:hypothetical protein
MSVTHLEPVNETMQTIEIASGSRKVIAFRNHEGSQWEARLYVNKGETATLTCGKFKTEKGLRAWAAKKLA